MKRSVEDAISSSSAGFATATSASPARPAGKFLRPCASQLCPFWLFFSNKSGNKVSWVWMMSRSFSTGRSARLRPSLTLQRHTAASAGKNTPTADLNPAAASWFLHNLLQVVQEPGSHTFLQLCNQKDSSRFSGTLVVHKVRQRFRDDRDLAAGISTSCWIKIFCKGDEERRLILLLMRKQHYTRL